MEILRAISPYVIWVLSNTFCKLLPHFYCIQSLLSFAYFNQNFSFIRTGQLIKLMVSFYSLERSFRAIVQDERKNRYFELSTGIVSTRSTEESFRSSLIKIFTKRDRQNFAKCASILIPKFRWAKILIFVTNITQ